jgi:serine phosphatase RsbU (regulator of sigma subunit)
MYHYFSTDNYEELKSTVAKLKEACLKTGDLKTYYKAWGNEIIKAKVFDGRPKALQMLTEMRDYATQHDHKFGLYSASYTTAYILNQLGDQQGAQENYQKALDYLKKYFPEESAAPIYVALSGTMLTLKKDSSAISYAQKALDDPHVTPTHRYMAKCNICMGWGWLRNVERFDEAYAKLKALENPPKESTKTQTVEVFRASLHQQTAEAIRLARQFKNKQSRVLYTYKVYEWAGDYKNALAAYKNYISFIDSVNNLDIRKQAELYHTELNVARAENETKDLRLANQQLRLEHVTDELEQQRLEAEAAELKLRNIDIELTNAAIRLKNDSLDRLTQQALLNEYQHKMNAIEQAERNKLITMLSVIAISLLTIGFLAFYLHRRQRSAKRLQSAYTELEHAYTQLEHTTAQKERIESELRIARDIQMSMVPRLFPQRSDLDIYALMQPAKAVGGDLYDFFVQDSKLFFCIGDVSGKGVPASMLMSVAVNLFRTIAKEGIPPEDVAMRLNETISADNESGMFITAFIGVADLQTGKLDYCNAGHNPPLLDGQFIDMESNAPLGLWPELEYVGEHIDTIKGKTFYLYTDGVNEAENIRQEQFGDDRLQALLHQRSYKNCQEIIETIKKDVTLFVGDAEQSDDLTMMCLRLNV